MLSENGSEWMAVETTVGIAKEGAFLTPGKKDEAITFYDNTRVSFRAADGSTTKPHGNWNMWWTMEGLAVLTLSFHYQGKENVPNLRSHTFYEILPGVFRTTDHWQIICFAKDIGVTISPNPLVVRPHSDSVKHPFVWFHPGRPPALLLMMKSGYIVYNSFGNAASEANGIYGYYSGGEEDTFITSFHAKAEPTEVLAILRRSSSAAGFWRAVGDQTGIPESRWTLRKWHIVMVPLIFGMNVVMGTGWVQSQLAASYGSVSIELRMRSCVVFAGLS
jgi:hypothetical protein